MEFVQISKEQTEFIKIGALQYGAVVIVDKVSNGGTPGVYIKVNKCSYGVIVEHTKNYCVLLNLKYGTLREISDNTVVRVLDSELHYNKTTNTQQYMK